MSYTVLARKYRPQKFADVIGQDHVVRTLKNALEQQRIAHGYIFSGHRGIGKTTIARILAMALNCQSSDRPVAEPCGVCDSCREIREGSVGAMDVIEIDAATNRGIEEVRSLIATASAEPARDRYRIFILDEAHQVTDAAFNALLKTLEEPPPWVVFMMATTQPEDIPQTIRSRCQHFSFHAVRFEDIVSHLREISAAEHLTVDEDALALLAEAGDGSMRDALSIMDQAISCSGDVLTAEVVRGLAGSVSTEVLERVMNAVHENSSDEVLRIVDKLMVEGQSATYFARQTVRFLRNALVAKVAGIESPILQISADEKKRVAGVASLFGEEELTRFLQIMLRTHGDVSYKQEQRFHLELGLLKMVHAQRLLPLEQLLSSVSLSDAASKAGPAAPSTSRQATAPRPAPAAFIHPAPARCCAHGRRLRRHSARRPPSLRRLQPTTPARAVKICPPRRMPRQPRPHPASSRRPTATALSHIPQASGGRTQAIAAGRRCRWQPARHSTTAVRWRLRRGWRVRLAAFDVDAIREAVLQAMETGGSQMLSTPWKRDTGPAGQPAFHPGGNVGGHDRAQLYAGAGEARRPGSDPLAGRTVKVRLVGGATAAAELKPRPSSARRAAARDSIKTRAADEPVVKRMMEKFGAEIRIVMDRSER